MKKTQRIAHTIIENILRNYPDINLLDTHEDKYKAIIHLELGGFKKGEVTTYSYPLKEINITPSL